MIVLQNTVREIVHRRHTKTTVGTTLKGHYWIEQYRLIQYIDGGYTQTTLTQWTEDRIETWRLPDLHLEEGAWQFMSAQFLLKRCVVLQPPADGEKKEKCFLPPSSYNSQCTSHNCKLLHVWQEHWRPFQQVKPLTGLHSRQCRYNNSSARFAKNTLLILLTANDYSETEMQPCRTALAVAHWHKGERRINQALQA